MRRGSGPGSKNCRIKSISVFNFELINVIIARNPVAKRIMDQARVLEGIGAAIDAGLTPVKVNMVVKRGVNDGDVVAMARHFRGLPVVLRFIEYMDVGNRNDWRPELVMSSAELARRIHERWPIEPVDRNYVGEVAERYRYLDGQGEIGFISSVTQPFCGDCSRARLSSDGTLYTCLFATRGTDLRAALRSGASDAELQELLGGVWRARTDRYSELRAEQRPHATQKVEMFHVGG